VKNPKVQVEKQNTLNTCVPTSLKEFSDVVKEISDAMQDGKISKEEAVNIRKEWEELKIVLESFVLGCEYGYNE
jgi:predicted GH43/DUF377 family glycosyl hydrolase